MPMQHWWVTDAWEQSPIILLAHVFWVIFSIVLHELAHGWTAIRCGDRTPIETGHMTWNPMVHMGPTSLLLFAIAGIAWGAMPVDPSRFRGRLDNSKVALAGPTMNLVLFGVALALCAGVKLAAHRIDETTAVNLLMFFVTGAYLNLALMLFNLLPVPPLDGWRIASDVSPWYRSLWRSERSPAIGLILFIALFWFGGPKIFDLSADLTLRALDAMMRAMPAHI